MGRLANKEHKLRIEGIEFCKQAQRPFLSWRAIKEVLLIMITLCFTIAITFERPHKSYD
jgi:hypothetical protein